MGWFFFFFFVSGFCSILYEIVWLRLAMAQFGVTSALVSIVLVDVHGGSGTGLLGEWIHPSANTVTASEFPRSVSMA